MEERTEKMQRTRMNVSISAKGVAQWDVTAEYETPEEAAKMLSSAIENVRAVIIEKGLTEACTAG